MPYISVKEAADKWGITERVVRYYCENDRIPGSFITGKTWNIPADADKPQRKPRNVKIPEGLFPRLIIEKENGIKGGIYHRIQIDITYNSNHIEGSRLTHDQTVMIFDTNTLIADKVNIDDLMETVNHFRCVDLVLDNVKRPLTERFIKHLHLLLKTNTSNSRLGWFKVGDYKLLTNNVGGIHPTADPEDVPDMMKKLLKDYNSLEEVGLDDILDFHCRFEKIHPFQDGNGRIGRLIMIKECLKNDIIPFIITDDKKDLYDRGIDKWNIERGNLRDTCLYYQDRFRELMRLFGIRE